MPGTVGTDFTVFSIKINISDIRLIPLDHVTYSIWYIWGYPAFHQTPDDACYFSTNLTRSVFTLFISNTLPFTQVLCCVLAGPVTLDSTTLPKPSSWSATVCPTVPHWSTTICQTLPITTRARWTICRRLCRRTITTAACRIRTIQWWWRSRVTIATRTVTITRCPRAR